MRIISEAISSHNCFPRIHILKIIYVGSNSKPIDPDKDYIGRHPRFYAVVLFWLRFPPPSQALKLIPIPLFSLFFSLCTTVRACLCKLTGEGDKPNKTIANTEPLPLTGHTYAVQCTCTYMGYIEKKHVFLRSLLHTVCTVECRKRLRNKPWMAGYSPFSILTEGKRV